jgi:hypothetical protein
MTDADTDADADADADSDTDADVEGGNAEDNRAYATDPNSCGCRFIAPSNRNGTARLWGLLALALLGLLRWRFLQTV